MEVVDMEKPMKRKPDGSKGGDGSFDLDALLQPAQAFGHPADIVNDADLTLREKHAILAAWASDVCAVDPSLRQMPGVQLVRFDDIMDAIRALDRQAGAAYRPRPHYRSVLEQRIPGVFGRKSPDDHGQPLN
jgi:hypothetical protein